MEPLHVITLLEQLTLLLREELAPYASELIPSLGAVQRTCPSRARPPRTCRCCCASCAHVVRLLTTFMAMWRVHEQGTVCGSRACTYCVHRPINTAL